MPAPTEPGAPTDPAAPTDAATPADPAGSSGPAGAPGGGFPGFAANLSLLFTELPFLDRFGAARDAGFDLVECQFPYEADSADIARRLAEHDLRMVLFNLPGGRVAEGERGIACLPERADEFDEGVGRALAYAERTGCTLLNVLAGRRPDGLDPATAWATLRDSVIRAARRCAEAGVGLLVEPVNTVDAPGYLLPGVSDVVRLLDDIGAADGADGVDVGISFDIYHVQRAEGDVTARMRAALPRIRHVQIADSPGRHQPGSGELNYPYVLAELDRLGYRGTVGLEYHPDPGTAESLRNLGTSLGPRVRRRHAQKAAL